MNFLIKMISFISISFDFHAIEKPISDSDSAFSIVYIKSFVQLFKVGPHTAIIATLRNKNSTKFYLVPRILQAVPADQATSYFGHGASGTPTPSGLSIRPSGAILRLLTNYLLVDSYIQFYKLHYLYHMPCGTCGTCTHYYSGAI